MIGLKALGKTTLLDDLDERNQRGQFVVLESFFAGDLDHDLEGEVAADGIVRAEDVFEQIRHAFRILQAFFDDVHVRAYLLIPCLHSSRLQYGSFHSRLLHTLS